MATKPMHAHKVKRYGWVPDFPDQRDHKFELPEKVVTPPKVDLRPKITFAPYDQGDLGCHCDRTEVLTERGWRYWTDYDGETRLGTMNPATHALEFQAPLALQVYDYDGPLVHGQHRALDFAVTPNHRMYLRKWNQRQKTLADVYDFVAAGQIGWYAGLPHATTDFVGVHLDQIHIGKQPLSGDDFITLLALVISDGWVGATEDNINRISFCCFDERYAAVAALAQRLGFGEVPSRKGVWLKTDAELATWLRLHIYDGAGYGSLHKCVPEILRSISSVQVDLFLREFGDQHIGKQGGRQFYTSSKPLADGLQELLLRIGKRGSICKDVPRDVVMRDGREIRADHCAMGYVLVERGTDRLSIDRKKEVGEDYYRGQVFCATVPNSLLVTRRNDKILISGNSCTANAIAGAVQFDRIKANEKPDFVPSRLFIYYNERLIEGTIGQDSGAMLRDGIKAIANWGVPPETEWPYDISRFTLRPGAPAYGDAAKHRGIGYARVRQTLADMRNCLAAGFPFVVGFSVYESFESDAVAKTGAVPMPAPSEQLLGGHAVLAVGYDDSAKRFTLRNSWGTNWGLQGYFTMPYDYLTNNDLSDDFWVVRVVSS